MDFSDGFSHNEDYYLLNSAYRSIWKISKLSQNRFISLHNLGEILSINYMKHNSKYEYLIVSLINGILFKYYFNKRKFLKIQHEKLESISNFEVLDNNYLILFERNSIHFMKYEENLEEKTGICIFFRKVAYNFQFNSLQLCERNDFLAIDSREKFTILQTEKKRGRIIWEEKKNIKQRKTFCLGYKGIHLVYVNFGVGNDNSESHVEFFVIDSKSKKLIWRGLKRLIGFAGYGKVNIRSLVVFENSLFGFADGCDYFKLEI